MIISWCACFILPGVITPTESIGTRELPAIHTMLNGSGNVTHLDLRWMYNICICIFWMSR